MIADFLNGRRFHFRPVLTVFMFISLGVLLSLGAWQIKRLQWKEALIVKVEERLNADPIPFEAAVARVEAGEDMEYAPVRLTGAPRPAMEERIFGAIEGAAGVFVFTPVEAADSLVYINRGFVPQQQGEWDCFCKEEAVTAVGLLRYAEHPTPPASWFRGMGQSADGLWLVRNPERFADAAGVKASSYYIDSFARDGALWPKGGTTRLDFRNKHMEYALTWFGLAATLFGVWLVFSLPKR